MPRGVGLDRDKVVDAAAALVDELGPDALTLATLADRLDVRSPSLFKHVSGLDDLRVAVAARAYRGLDAALATHADDLVAIAHAWRAWAAEHPGVYALAARVPADRLDTSATLARVLAAVALSTGPGEPAVHGARALRALVHGFVLLEQAGGFGLPAAVDTSFDAAVQALVAGLGRPPGRGTPLRG